jgi:two-component system, OmpR family, response regulator
MSQAKRRVLIVEDNRDANDSLAMLVEMLGFEVAQAMDGPAALLVASEFRPHVVFCDVGLPGMDGYQVVKGLRALPSASPMIVAALTGYGEERDREQSSLAGFDHHFVKPIAPDQLQDFLNRYH